MRSLGLLFCPLFLLAVHGEAEDAAVHQDGKVSVRLEQLDGPGPDILRFRSSVQDGIRCYSFLNGPFGSGSDRPRTLLSQVSGQDGYLFVPASCGGGNASKCQGFQAFSTKDGLRWLGYLTGRWTGSKVLVYEAGVFFDTGDMLEINDLLSHAESPRYAMAYTDKKGLRFDPARTWALNAEALTRSGADKAGLLYRAGLAKLCGKKKELAQALKAAKSLNAQEQKAFASSLKQVDPKSVKPHAFLPVGPCAGGPG